MRSNGRAAIDSTQPVEADWSEDTAPDVPEAITNAALLRAIKALGDRVESLGYAVGGLRRLATWCAVGAGALALFGLLLWWSR